MSKRIHRLMTQTAATGRGRVIGMLTPEQACKLVAMPESERIERKRAFSDAEAVRLAICAFANDMPGSGKPGYVLIGVEDDGQLACLPVTDDLLLRLSKLRDEGNILPLPRMEVYRVEIEPGVEIAVVEVAASMAGPVRLRGRTCIRVGPRQAIASLEEEGILVGRQRLAMDDTFDQKPYMGRATIDDLRLDFFREEYLPRMVAKEVLEHDTRPVKQQLAALRLWADWVDKPTIGSILLIAKDPRMWLSGLWTQFVRFDGPDRAKVIADAKYEGSVFDQLKALEQISKNIRSVRTASGEEVPDYPEEAIRELVINAILHREYDVGNSPIQFYWYSDHVEILNPGGLFGRLTTENFGKKTSYRNEVLAEAMRAFGYVHKFGTGIPAVHRTLKANGNPPAVFDLVQPGFGVDVYARKDGA